MAKNKYNSREGEVIKMEKSIEWFLTEVLKLQDCDVVQRLSNCGEIRRLKAKEVLFCHGEKPEYLAFLLDGIMRSFVIDEKGKDSTECFDYEFGCPVVPSIPMDAPASVNIEADVDSELMLFPIEEVTELITTNVEISHIYNLLMCKSMKRYVELNRAITQYKVEQRYKWFLSEYAELDGRVSNKDIASFLNMTPVTLSRVRNEWKG